MKITFKGVEKEVNFTEPQAKIMKRLLNGEKVILINKHHLDGGELVWYNKDGNYYGAERVYYKPFNGAMYALEKAFENTTISDFYSEYMINF